MVAPASCAPAIAAQPTPPRPITASDSPRWTWPVLIAAPMPAITPQPSRPATSAGASSETFVHWPSWTRVFSEKEPMPRAAVSSVPSVSVMGLEALWVSKQYCCTPFLQARHSPHTARQFSTT